MVISYPVSARSLLSRRRGWVLLASLASVLWPCVSDALPRFAARTGMACATCHVNPTGSGARTRYGANVYAQKALPMQLGEVEIGAIPTLDFGNEFSAAIGADVRVLYVFEDARDEPAASDLNSFFPMQADLYVTAELGPYLTFYFDRGITNFEAFGMLHLRERRAWLKIGQFVMPYGLRLADHSAFIREETGFSPQLAYYGLDTGVEVGWRPGPFTFALAMANGKSSLGAAPVAFDDNDDKAFYGLAEFRFGPDRLPLRVGLSGYKNAAGRQVIGEEMGNPVLERDTRVDKEQLGAYLTATLGRFTYLGEFDWLRTEIFSTDAATLQSSSQDTEGYAVFNALNFLVIQGLDLQVQLELLEADLDDEVDEIRRIGAGFEAFPIPMFDVKFLWRRTLDGEREDIDEVAAIAHFYF